MNKRYLSLIIPALFFAIANHCHGQLPTKDIKSEHEIRDEPPRINNVVPNAIVVTHLDLDTKYELYHKELDYPALAATNIKIGISEKPCFFMDEFNKANHKRKLELMTRAPWALTKQFHKSKNPVVKENPWFLYQGLEDFKKLKNIYASELKSKMEALNNGFLKTFNELLIELPLIKISTTQGRVGFSQLWLDATSEQQRDAVLRETIAEIVSKRALEACRELVRFMGVLGHAFSTEERIQALIKCVHLLPEKDVPLMGAVFFDLRDGPDAQTIAQMAIRDRDLKA